MLWDRDKDEQLDTYLNTYFSELTDVWRFYQDLDYNQLARMLNFEDVDLIKLKTDELFDSKMFNSKFEIEPEVVHSTKLLREIRRKIQQEIDALGLDKFIGEEEAKVEETKTVKPVTPITKSIPGGRRVSLDLMQRRPNLHIPSKPALINATMVNINVEPLKFAMRKVDPPATHPKPKSFLFKFGKTNKTKPAKQEITTDQSILEQRLLKQRRRTSFMEESLPAYIKQQIGNKLNQPVSNDEQPVSPVEGNKRNSEPAIVINSIDSRLAESVRSKSHTIEQNPPSPKAPAITQIVPGNIRNQNSQDNSQQNSPAAAKRNSTIDDSELTPNTNRFHNLLSNSQHLYSHTKDVHNQPESPTTTTSDAPDTIHGYTEDEYVLPHVITRYYELQNEDSQEREEFLRALDDDDTDFINLNGNYDDNDNDNESNDEYKDQERTVEDEYLF